MSRRHDDPSRRTTCRLVGTLKCGLLRHSGLMSLSCVLGLDSNRRLTSEPVPEMRAGRRALAAVPDWRLRASRLEIELVAFGAGPNGGRNRDAEY